MAMVRGNVMLFHRDKSGPLRSISLNALRTLGKLKAGDDISDAAYEDVLRDHRDRIEAAADKMAAQGGDPVMVEYGDL